MKKRVLIHAPNLSTPGGKQTYFTSLLDYFESDISFFFYGAQGKKESILGMVSRLLRDYVKFYRTLRKNDYNLVHLNPSLNMKSFFRDSIFAMLCRLTNTKMTVFWHGWQWAFEKKTVRKFIFWFKMTFGKADSMIVLAKEFSDQLKTYGYKKPIHQVTTVADPIFFKLGAEVKKQNLEDIANKPLTLLFLSRIERAKGIYEALDSFENLRKEFPSIQLKVAGTGGELDAAKQYAADKQLEGVDFLGWVVGEEKARIFSECDIYLLPSYHGEGLPCSILEAMALGLPVITTDVGGIKDFFEDKKMGHFVEMKNPAMITEKVKLLLHNPSQNGEIRQYNINYAKNRFTPKKVGSELERIYSETVAS